MPTDQTPDVNKIDASRDGARHLGYARAVEEAVSAVLDEDNCPTTSGDTGNPCIGTASHDGGHAFARPGHPFSASSLRWLLESSGMPLNQVSDDAFGAPIDRLLSNHDQLWLAFNEEERERDAARKAVAAVRYLHQQYMTAWIDEYTCAHCNRGMDFVLWPCPTIKALDGDDRG